VRAALDRNLCRCGSHNRMVRAVFARGSRSPNVNTLTEARLRRTGSLERNPRLSQWLRVERDGTVSVFSGKVEIGQGILTALAQIAAEELGIALERIRMVAADTSLSPMKGDLGQSLDSGFRRRTAARVRHARALLLERAAERLGVPIGALQVKDGTVRAGGRSTTYWECSDEGLFDRDVEEARLALARRSPGDRHLQPAARSPRQDRWPTSLRPGHGIARMLHGRVIRPLHGFAGLDSIDDAKARSIPGVVAIVRDGGFLGVLAEREDAAIAAQRALRSAASWKEPATLPRTFTRG